MNPIVDALRETSMLVKVSGSFIGTQRTDKRASEDADIKANAANGTGKVVVKRLAGADQLDKAIRNNFTNMKSELARITMPYGDNDGWRILATQNFDKALRIFGLGKREHDRLVSEVQAKAQEIVNQARQALGDYDVTPPSLEELMNGYKISSEFIPIPDASDFKGLPAQVQEKLKQKLNGQIESAYERAKEDTMERFVPLLKRFVERMEAYGERKKGGTNGRVGTFEDSIVGNIAELQSMLGAFNIDNDPRLTELAEMLSGITATSPKDLRKDDTIRESAALRAAASLSKLDEWLAPYKK